MLCSDGFEVFVRDRERLHWDICDRGRRIYRIRGNAPGEITLLDGRDVRKDDVILLPPKDTFFMYPHDALGWLASHCMAMKGE